MATLKAKQKDLKAKGLGNKPRTSDSLTDEEIEKLYAAKCLGIESSQAVMNTLRLNSTIHFGFRRGKKKKETERFYAGEMSYSSKRPKEESIRTLG